MAQLPVREFDAKRLRSLYSGDSYVGFLVDSEETKATLTTQLLVYGSDALRVVKPDQLFGKRGKYGLVGVKLTASQVTERIDAHWHKEYTIQGVTDVLHTFLVEPFVPHEGEWYLSISTERDADVIRFSACGGIDIEEQRESVREVRVGVLEQIDDKVMDILLHMDRHASLAMTNTIQLFIQQFFAFFRSQGFTSLEVNPFVIVPHPDPLLGGEGVIRCLDMVAKVDSCEEWRQKMRKEYISRVKPFGTKQHSSEQLVEELDAKTGASLKLTIMNPEGRVRFLLGGGGASVIALDTMTRHGLLHEVANYGELSGNPDEDSNRAYVTTLIETMLANGKSDQYLCLIGGIANFTDIPALVQPLCVVLEVYAPQFRDRRITVLMRRGGLRVEQAIVLLEKTCTELGIAYKIHDDEHYLTEIFDEMRL